MKVNKPKLTILGQGAIGLLFASYLRRAFDIQLLVRKKSPLSTVSFEDLNQEFHPLDFDCLTLEEVANIDLLLLPIKSYQIAPALKQVQKKLANNATVIISHNGMPDIPRIDETLKSQQCYFLTTSMAALKVSNTHLKHTGLGASFLGSLNGQACQNKLIHQIEAALPGCSIQQDIQYLLWQKLLINIAINPLTAVHQVKNGELANPKYASRIIGLLNEAAFIAKQEGINISLSEALNNAYRVIHATAANFSSMNRDVYKNQQTEIESICGYIIKKGAEYHYSTPYNQQYLSLIQGDKP